MGSARHLADHHPAGHRVARVRAPDGTPRAARVDGDRLTVLAGDDPLGALRGEGGEPVAEVVALDPETLDLPAPWELLVPVEAPEVWCAGVTYERSRDARLGESAVKDVYAMVYDAQRPELFLKDAAGRRTVGPRGTVAVRSDATWSVPEPELGLVLGEDGEPVAVTAGNDVSSRDIEGANPLYLPQAKVYAAACALGPALLAPADWSAPFAIELRVTGPDGQELFAGSTSTERMTRTFADLVAHVRHDNPVPAGSVLLTGTGLVPPDELGLAPGHVVEIRIPGIGTLVNPVARADQLPHPTERTAARV